MQSYTYVYIPYTRFYTKLFDLFQFNWVYDVYAEMHFAEIYFKLLWVYIG